MKRSICSLIATLLLSYLSTPCYGQESRWGSADEPTVKEIVAMEARWASSDCGPEPELAAVIAVDFQGTAPDGHRYPKAKAIETDINALARDCRLGEVRVRFFGDSLAIAYGTESNIPKAKQGNGRKHCLVWTDTWLKRDGRWQIIAAQDTSLPCTHAQ